MGYYQGDHYRRGDYYRGDPSFLGFIGSALGGLAKTALKVGTSILNPAGPISALGGQAVQGAARAGAGAIVPGGGAAIGALQDVSNRLPLIGTSGGVKVPPALGGGMAPPGMAMIPAAGMHLRKMHANRSTYITRGGGTSRWPVGIVVHPKGTEAVPSRRMNVANPRALRRALRRAHGFAKLARRFLVVTKHFKRGKKRRR